MSNTETFTFLIKHSQTYVHEQTKPYMISDLWFMTIYQIITYSQENLTTYFSTYTFRLAFLLSRPLLQGLNSSMNLGPGFLNSRRPSPFARLVWKIKQIGTLLHYYCVDNFKHSSICAWKITLYQFCQRSCKHDSIAVTAILFQF